MILSTSMAGTTMSGFMNRDASAKYLSGGATKPGWGPQGLGLGYPEGAAILISILLLIFLGWKLSGMTFQITEIVTFRGEALFWSAILVSNTLGTPMGDFLSDSSGLGYAGGALLVTGVLAVLLLQLRAEFPAHQPLAGGGIGGGKKDPHDPHPRPHGPLEHTGRLGQHTESVRIDQSVVAAGRSWPTRRSGCSR